MNNLQPLLQKEVSRKEFLTIASVGMASIFGFSTIIKLLTGRSTSSTSTTRSVKGYSNSDYGSKKSSSRL